MATTQSLCLGHMQCPRCSALKIPKHAWGGLEARLLQHVCAALSAAASPAASAVLTYQAHAALASGGVCLLTELVVPPPRMPRDVAGVLSQPQCLTDLQWRSLWLQLLAALAELQRLVPGFQHNDLKPDNLLLAPLESAGPRPTYSGSVPGRRLRAHASSPGLKIVDLGLATSSVPGVEGLPVGQHPMRELSRGCAALDLQRAACYILTSLEPVPAAGRPAWFQPWLAFVQRWLPRGLCDASSGQLNAHMLPRQPYVPLLRRLGAAWPGWARLLDDPYFDMLQQANE